MKHAATLSMIVFCLVGCGKGARDYELGSADFGADTLLMVEKEMGLKLPRGAKGLNFYYKAPIDPAFIAKIEIPSGARDEVARQVSAFPDMPITSNGGLAARVSWWTPTVGKVLHDREFVDGSNGRYRRAVLADEDGTCLLYIDWRT